MATYRCPTHDCVFDTETDQSAPGKVTKGKDGKPDTPADPLGCHPDCPVGKRERAEKSSQSKPQPQQPGAVRRIG